jgi:hypothetical protein
MTIPEPVPAACRAPTSRQPGAGPPGGETCRAAGQHPERDEDRSRDGELQWHAAEAAAHELRQERHANVTIFGFTRLVRKPRRQAQRPLGWRRPAIPGTGLPRPAPRSGCTPGTAGTLPRTDEGP